MNADPDGAPTPAADEWLSRRSQEAEQAVDVAFDLSACVREPIHLLGGVQSYGTLLAAEVASGTVVTAADNTARLLGVEARELVGGPVLRVLGAPDWEEAVALSAEGEGAVLSLPVTAGAGPSPRAFDLSVHRRDGLLVLEFEPGEADPAASRDFYQGVRRALGRLRSAASVAECCATAVREMRALTGFERVVAYRFDGADGPGEVVAESVADGWEPWLGLWFPATDIPPQARRLYEENWIRVIGDVDDATARLVPERRADTGGVLDLSRAGLRTVSGFHLEYLRNIGVRSSMSVSVLRDGRLWGLIACHGADPKRLGPEVRSACELFGTAFSLHLTALEERDRADSLVGVGGRAASVARLLGTDVYDSLLRHEAEVRELAGADGLVVARDGQVRTTGPAVGARLAGELKRLAAGLAPGQVWATDRLAETLEAGGGDASAAEGGPSGVLLIALERGRSYLAWTRVERPEPRRWAADPDRPVRVGPRGERLTPRGSGAVFRSVTRGRSLPWQAREEHTALELWRLLTGMVLRHADELSALNEELRVINADLDSFAHAAAHDLKEPLRGSPTRRSSWWRTPVPGWTPPACAGSAPCGGWPAAWTTCSTPCCTTPAWAAADCAGPGWSWTGPWTTPWRWPGPGSPTRGYGCCGPTASRWWTPTRTGSTTSWSTSWSTPPSTRRTARTGPSGWRWRRSPPVPAAGSRSWSGTTASASRRNGRRRSSGSSSGCTAPPSTTAAPASASPSSGGSWSGTADASG